MSIIDDLIASGHVNSESEGASYLMMLGVKSHASFYELSKEVVVLKNSEKIKSLIESSITNPGNPQNNGKGSY